MRRTASTVARLHAVPIPDALQNPQPTVWSKTRQFLNSATGTYSNPHKTDRYFNATFLSLSYTLIASYRIALIFRGSKFS